MKYVIRISVLLLSALCVKTAFGDTRCDILSSKVWNDSYTMRIAVGSTGSHAINTWEVTLAFDEPSNIRRSWGANRTGSV